MWWGMVCALAAAGLYGVAAVLQAAASRATERGTRSVDPMLLVRVLRQWRFVAGVGLDLLGALAQLIALRVLPLFLVQAALAASLAVTAVLARVLGAPLGRREWVAVLGVCAGLALLGTSAHEEGSAAAGTGFRLGLVVTVVVLAALGAAVGRLPDTARATGLGLISGLGFGVVAISGRVITSFEPLRLLADPAAYAVAGGGIVAMLFFTSALQQGKVTTATAMMVVGETVMPALIGVLVLGDRTRPGFVPVAIAGFAIAIAAAVALARFGEPQTGAEPVAAAPQPERHG
jgi:drug/metabolite transporter (DMT)-like permease